MTNTKLAKNLVNKISKISKKKKLKLHEPNITNIEKKYINEALNSTYVSTYGNLTTIFEDKIKKYTGNKFAIATINGTSALHLSLLTSDVKVNDEVLVPTLTFVGTINAIKYCSAIPHFIDSDPQTLGVDPKLLENWLEKIALIKNRKCYNKITGREIKALIAVHVFGHPCEIDKICNICKKFNIKLIEDAAGALGSFYKRVHVGNFGIAGILSFNGNKILTTGGGGIILTNNYKFAIKARLLANTSKENHKWDFLHSCVGYNYRLPNLNAALGLAQLEKLNKYLISKRNLYIKYKKIFSKIEDIKLFKEPEFSKSNYWLQTIVLNKPSLNLRNEILEYTNKNKIQTRPVWKLMHKFNWLKNSPKSNLKNAINLEKRIINIPSSTYL